MISSQPPTPLQSAMEWCAMDPNPITANHVAKLIQDVKGGDTTTSDSMTELSSLFPSDGRRISFGTAGLRSAMKPGPLGMNDLVVLQAAQGIAKYALQTSSKTSTTDDKKPKGVIGYDHRSNPGLNISSLSFAILTALVFQEAGIEPILLDGYAFTPLIPFCLQKTEAIVGIMVTASHNPKQDNGYKVYASDGCQIRSPMDSDISKEIMANLAPWKDYGSVLQELQKKSSNDDPCLGLSDPEMTKSITNDYFAALKKHGLMTEQATMSSTDESLSPPSFAYTAMHGVGHPFAERVFSEFGLPPFVAIPDQKEPDFTFPTVPFPNPEEKGALDIAKAYAVDQKCDIVLANDPDADRLAVAEKDRSTGEWTVFSGDQIGIMLGHWMWTQIGKNCDKPVSMCGSTVSSKMLAEIARVEGFHFEDTLTGFKWIGSRSQELSKKEGYRNLFCYEEAIGFCCGDVIFDKDGVSAMAVFSEMALYEYRQGLTLKQHMQSLYDKYGEFVSHNGYYRLEDSSVVHKIMDRIRCNGKYDLEYLSPYQVEYIRDLGVPGYDSSKPDKQPTLPCSASSPMISIGFTNGCLAQFRASGTEPKFKYYIEMKGSPGKSREEVSKELHAMTPIILERLLEPEKNGLKIPSKL
ncbi:unnamed protein product [Cylindrotheca closterium]|uniref:Uncharacterized protein n=1 Tax=Cylindrotheca closterium TaxID=2856 RepID=A0AAD2JLR4_9STRA|nr:unnamed protein product [Cylindrotheca closterium]